jgi:arginine deiminase
MHKGGQCVENEKWNPQKAVQSIKGGVSRLFDNLPASRSLQEENARLKEALDNAEAEVQRLNETIDTLRREANGEARQMLQAFLVQMEALRLEAAQSIDAWREKEQQLQDEETRLRTPLEGTTGMPPDV